MSRTNRAHLVPPRFENRAIEEAFETHLDAGCEAGRPGGGCASGCIAAVKTGQFHLFCSPGRRSDLRLNQLGLPRTHNSRLPMPVMRRASHGSGSSNMPHFQLSRWPAPESGHELASQNDSSVRSTGVDAGDQCTRRGGLRSVVRLRRSRGVSG
jgi:hypothetical protein